MCRLTLVVSLIAGLATLPLMAAPVASTPAGKPVTVETFSPQGEAHPVRQVTARFSEAVVRFGGGKLFNPFRIGCAVPGKGRWLDTRTWVYDFERELPAGLACQFVPVTGLVTASGKPVAESPTYRFQTAAPQVVDVYPYDGEENISEDQLFLFKFDGENDRQKLLTHTYCLVENIKEKIPLRFLTPEESRALISKLPSHYQEWWNNREGVSERRMANCSRQLPPGSKVKIVIAKGMASASGVVRKEDQEISYQVRDSFKATLRCTRENARQGCAPILPIRLEFSEYVEPQLLSAIRLKAGEKVWLPKSGNEEGDIVETGTSVVFNPPFPPNTALTLTLPAGMKDVSDRVLSNAVRFPLSVKIAGYPPLAKFASDVGVIEAASAAVPLTLRNLEPVGSNTEARLYTQRLPDSDKELISWLKRFQKHQEAQSCYTCVERNDDGKPKEPDPRSQALIAKNTGVVSQLLPRKLSANDFEVIGIPVEKGVYIHEVESRYLGNALMDQNVPMYVSALSMVTNLGVHLRNGPQGGLVWVTTLDKGEPVAGASVAIYDCKNGQAIWQGKTGNDGVTTFQLQQDLRDYDDGCLNNRYAVIARTANDRAMVLPRWDEGIQSWRFGFNGWKGTGSLIAHSILDRTLLRAGETLHMRHVVRRRALDDLQASDKKFKRLYVYHEGSGQTYELPMRLDASGNGDNEWKVPVAAKLGQYSVYLETSDGSSEQMASFRVEEFRLPVLKADFRIVNQDTVAAKSLPLALQLNYLNGGAYAKAAVTLRGRVTEFGFQPADYEDYVFREATESESEKSVMLEEQRLTLNEQGSLQVQSHTLPAVKHISRLTMEMEYRDPSGETHTAITSTTLWPASVVAGVKLPEWVNTAGNEAQTIEIVTLGQNGKIRPNMPVTVNAEVRSSQTHRRRTVGGFYAYETVKKQQNLPLQCGTKTNAEGKLSCRFSTKASGEIVVSVTARDEMGRTLTSSASTWVSNGGRWWFDQGNDDRIDILPAKKEYRAGENMALQVRMPFPEATALVSIERDGIMETLVQKLRAEKPVIELPVKAEYAPNVFVSALLVRGRNAAVAPTALVDLGKPAFKLGIAEVNVDWDSWRLGVAVKADKKRYQPRESAQVSVQVTPPTGQNLPVGTEVTLFAVDEALLELSSNRSVDVLTPMMQARSHNVETATSQLQVVGKRHYGRKSLPPGGGGGRQAATRELFDTLAFWQARARVDAQGRAQFTVPLNDSLTGFRVQAVATSRNRFGEGHAKVETFKEVSVLSGLPLIVRQGDVLDPVFTVRNASEKDQTLKFRAELKGSGLTLEKNLNLKAGESMPVAVPFTVPANVTSLNWQVSVEGENARDALSVSQKVLDAVPERVLQSTLFQLEKSQDIPVQKPAGSLPGGALQLSAQASLADSLQTVQEWFRAYPYTCLEQTSSIAVGLQDRARWDALMEKLPAYQDEKGLLSFYPQTRGYPFLTAHILQLSASTGWPIPAASRDAMLKGLSDSLEGKSDFDDWRMSDLDDTHRRLEVMAALAQHKQFRSIWLDTLKADYARWTASMLVNWLTLLNNSTGISLQAQKRAQAENLLRSRITQQGTLAILSEGRYTRWWLYDTNEATQARLILATLDLPTWQADIPKLVRGLVSLQQQGRWSTTQANLWGAEALRRFSQQFEKETVTGQTRFTLEGVSKNVAWQGNNPESQRMSWPKNPASLQVEQEGTGKPWVTVQARARLPLKQPESAGFSVSKTLKAVQQKVPGQWSVGDVVQVRLVLKAQNDIGWVVVDDPVPAGSTLLGRALAKDSSLAADNAEEWTWATYVEYAADAWRGYYERINKGEWEAIYTLRLNQSGNFRLPPTRVEALYAPEMYGALPNANWVVKP